jgi:hypothetical protein
MVGAEGYPRPSQTAKEVVVAFLDTGFTPIDGYSNRIKQGQNFSNSTNNNDGYGHGNMTGSVLFQEAPNVTGYSIKIFDDTGNVIVANILKAIEYAHKELKASIIIPNFAFSTTRPYPEFTAVLQMI